MSKNKYSRVLSYIKPYWRATTANVIFNILIAIFSVFSFASLIPFLDLLFNQTEIITQRPEWAFNKDAIFDNMNYYLGGIIQREGKLSALAIICVFISISFLLRNISRYFALFFMAKVRVGALRDMRKGIYDKLLVLPISFYKNRKKGDVLARFSTEVQEIEYSIMNYLEMLFRDPITIIINFSLLLFISAKLTVFVVIILPVTGYVIGKVGKTLRKESTKGQQEYAGILSLVEETVSGLKIIKAFNAIGFLQGIFDQKNGEFSKRLLKIYRRKDLSSPLSEFLSSIIIIVILWFGGQLVLDGDSNIKASDFITYIVVFSQVIPPAKTFSQGYYAIQKGIASAERIFEVLDSDEVIHEKDNAKGISEFKKEIRYDNVSFKYAEDIVLDNVSVSIDKGKVIALVGPSGGGKSTMVDILPRFYDVIDGNIKIDGIDTRDLKIEDLRSLFGIVTQEPILFNDTVFNNIAFGCPDVSEEDVIEAAKIANAHEFIEKMDEGYQSNIGDRGGKLSGGQRQRLSIARAILKNPPILILDEATSSLDTESEKLVQKAITRVMEDRTSIVIAHRLSTIQHADEILVIEKGKIVEKGSHLSLIEKNGVYKKLHDIQSL
ncbi:MAG: ABC transporter ATP-binding protein [Hyphomicrobiales bacterium]